MVSLQQFAKGCGGFVTEMADAILNGLTNGRHSKFAQLVEKEENLPAEKSSTGANGEESSGPLPEENGEIIPKQENVRMCVYVCARVYVFVRVCV